MDCPNTQRQMHVQQHRHLQTDYCICKSTGPLVYTHTHTRDKDHMVCATGRQAVRKRGIEVQGLAQPKPLGPNRIRRLGYCRAYCLWDTEARFLFGQRNTLSLYIYIKIRLTSRGCDQGGKSPPAKHWLIWAVVGTFIHSAVPAGLITMVLLYAFSATETKRSEVLAAGVCGGMDVETLSPPSRQSSSHTLHQSMNKLIWRFLQFK